VPSGSSPGAGGSGRWRRTVSAAWAASAFPAWSSAQTDARKSASAAGSTTSALVAAPGSTRWAQSPAGSAHSRNRTAAIGAVWPVGSVQRSVTSGRACTPPPERSVGASGAAPSTRMTRSAARAASKPVPLPAASPRLTAIA